MLDVVLGVRIRLRQVGEKKTRSDFWRVELQWKWNMERLIFSYFNETMRKADPKIKQYLRRMKTQGRRWVPAWTCHTVTSIEPMSSHCTTTFF